MMCRGDTLTPDPEDATPTPKSDNPTPDHDTYSGFSTPDTSAPSFQELLNETHNIISSHLEEMKPVSYDSGYSQGSATADVVDSIMNNRDHMRSVPVPSPQVPTIYTCDVCGKTFTKSWVLDKHCKSAHSATMLVPKECKCGKITNIVDSHVCYECNICGQAFQRRLLLHQHEIQYHPKAVKRCAVCSTEYLSQQALNKHEIECRIRSGPRDGPVLECRHCKNRLKSFRNYTQHQTNHASLSHICPICQEGYCMLAKLFTHIAQDHHNGREMAKVGYFCPLCQRRFIKHRKYAYHILDMHETNPHNVAQEVSRKKLRKYMYTPKKYLMKKLPYLDESWMHEGDYMTNEDIVTEEVTRSSSRIEQMSRSGGLSMLPGIKAGTSGGASSKRKKKD